MSTTTQKPAPHKPATVPSWWQRQGRLVWLGFRLTLLAAAMAAALWWLLLSPVSVTTHTVERGSVTAEVLGTGTLEARYGAGIGPKVAGLVTKITVDQGDHVKIGDTLVCLEDTDFRQQVAMAEAELAAWSAGVDRLQADKRRAEAVLDHAKLTRERLQVAMESDATSVQEVDNASEAVAIAEAEVSRAEAAIIEGQRRLTAADRSLAYHQARLADTNIKAPFDALVIRRDRDVGDVVTAGSMVLELVSLREMWITAWVDETELARLDNGQTARVVFRSEMSATYSGVLARIGREADRETREIVVDVRLDTLPANWAVGQRAEVYLQVDTKEQVTVLPAPLLLVRHGVTGVMLDDGGKARWREVAIGLRGRDMVEVISGLQPGDIVVRPQRATDDAIRDGRRIRSQ